MKFGEKLKRVRTEQGLTQPQFAERLGIEQSYLSKLENDKSIPSAEMFATILTGTGMDAPAFLRDIDQEVLTATLRHIPEVDRFNTRAVVIRVHHHKRWLYGSALAWLAGFALMLAANDGIVFPNKVYRYVSPGVILAGEADDIFEKQEHILVLRQMAKVITPEEFARQLADFKANRAKPLIVETTTDRGSFYTEPAENGRRRFEQVKVRHVEAFGNRILQYLGAIVFASGFIALFIEWRLRRMKNKAH